MDKKNFVILLVSTLIAAFLGAFIASFAIYKMIMPPPPPPFGPHLDASFVMNGVRPPSPKDLNEAFERNEKMVEQQEEFFDKFNDEVEDSFKHMPNTARFVYVNNSGLRTQETKDMYKVTVDLKPFNNDEKNVNVEVKNKTVTISAKYKSDDKKQFSSSQFFQTITLPSKIDSSLIKQEKKGNFLVITIPKIQKK